MIPAGISVIICAYNSAKRLPETIRHLAQQNVREGIPWEVLVVDNASTDNTAQVAQIIWDECKGTAPFQVIYEPKAGLTYAREAGFAHAKYNYLLLCDDDNWLKSDYVTLAFDIMEQHPTIGVLGGNGELVFEDKPEDWVKNLGLYASGPQAPASGPVPDHKVFGAGSVLRKTAFDAILAKGFKSMLTDRSGAQLTSGGDYELCYALALANYQIWYDERLIFKHFTPPSRLTWEYYYRYIKESSTCFSVLEPYKFVAMYGSSSILDFNVRYLRSFLYHIKKFVPVAYRRITSTTQTDTGKVRTLQYNMLVTRLLSYKEYRDMKNNYRKIQEVKKMFQEH